MPHTFFHQARTHLWHRAQLYADLPLILRTLKYRKIRKKFYDHLWSGLTNKMGASVFHDQFGYTRITKDGMTTLVKQHELMLDSQLMLNIMGNKRITYDLLSQIGAPVVPYLAYNSSQLNDAEKFLEIHGTVVVKPASGTGGGRGVTTNIFTVRQLKAATRAAARFDSNLIVEKQLNGASYRLLFLGGKFIDAIRRDPPCVAGDGVSTIKQLIKAENRHRELSLPTRALSPLVIDKDCQNWLKSNSMLLSDIPGRGDLVQVKQAVNENNYYGNVKVTHSVNHAIIDSCTILVQRLGVIFAGVDLICNDITGEFQSPNCVVGEVNTTPGLHHHYLIDEPAKVTPVAEIALDYIFQNRIGTMQLGQRLPITNPNTPSLVGPGEPSEAPLPDSLSPKV